MHLQFVLLGCLNFLQHDKKEYILSRQALKSGTAVGALIREAEYGQSKADFINKMNIALKEAGETGYWLNILKDTEYIAPKYLKACSSIATNCWPCS